MLSKAFFGWLTIYTFLIASLICLCIGMDQTLHSTSTQIGGIIISLGVGACLACTTLDVQENRREKYDREDHDDEDDYTNMGY